MERSKEIKKIYRIITITHFARKPDKNINMTVDKYKSIVPPPRYALPGIAPTVK
jgi:hypothetical protein